MIRLHGDTNAISLNERPAVWPPLIPHVPTYSPFLLFLLNFLSSFLNTFSFMFIDLF